MTRTEVIQRLEAALVALNAIEAKTATMLAAIDALVDALQELRDAG